MELNPTEKERLRIALITTSAALATVVGVKYIRDHEDRIKGYFYNLNRGKDWLMGIYRNPELTDIAQISGGMDDDQIAKLDSPQVTPEDVEKFEAVTEIVTQNQQASQKPLQNR